MRVACKIFALMGFFLLVAGAVHATEGIVVYVNKTASMHVPQYRIWNGTDFSEQKSTGLTMAGEVQWLKVVTNPVRDEAILGAMDNSSDIFFAVYNGYDNTWGNMINVSRVGKFNARGRAFDIAYENITGRALAVFKNGTGAPGENTNGTYMIWNGAVWGSQTEMAQDTCVGGPSWVRVESQPGSNNITFVGYNVTTADICAQIWDGTTWGNTINLTISAEVTTPKQIFDIAPERKTRRMMVAWAEDVPTRGNTRIWNGTGWESNITLPAGALTLAASIQWISLASDVDSNRILYSSVDGGLDLDVWHWNGTRWGAGAEPDAAIETLVTRDIASGFYNGTGNAMNSAGVILYGTGTAGDTDFGPVDCNNNTTCDTGTYTVRASVTGCGANVNWVSMQQDPFNSSRAMATTISQGAANNVCLRPFNNTVWHNTLAIGTATQTALTGNESASFAYKRTLQKPILKANITIASKNTVFTGNESATVTGACESINGTSSALTIFLQNSTDNVSFTTITTSNAEAVYANVSSYYIKNLTNLNSSNFVFQVNATKPHINYSLRIQCNATNSLPIGNLALNNNASSNNLSVSQAFGYLNVSLVGPAGGTTYNVSQLSNFTINASVQCTPIDNLNPTVVCEQVNGSIRRNSTSGGLPDVIIQTFSGATPFWTPSNLTCGSLSHRQNCSLNWTVNATGDIGTLWVFDVNFTSNWSLMLSNATERFNVSIASAQDLSYTLSIPAPNGTIFNTTQTTTAIIFNTTDLNAKKVNATNVAGGTAVQTATTAIFRYNNTGSIYLNVTLNFSAALPSGVIVKAGWSDTAWQPSCTAINLTDTTSCANITATTNMTIVANISTSGLGKARDVWLWADYNGSVPVNTDSTVNLNQDSIVG